MDRSMSESNLLEQAKATPANRNVGLTPRFATASTLDMRTPRQGEAWTGGKPIETRQHRFERMPSLLKFSSCDVCNGGINFAAKPAVRCIDCNQQAHVACKRRLTVPCVPRSATPRTPSRSRLGPKLQEFCPPTAPMIPAPLIHCVVAIEKKNLNQEGLYRIPGRKEQVLRVLNELKTSRAVPKLELQDLEVIADCIKRFLTELRDPLIPRTSREEFIRAAQEEDKQRSVDMLHKVIMELPQPNRDTLAYLMLHWHRVGARGAVNKMPVSNLVRMLAPSVVGYSSTGGAPMTNSSAVDDTTKQQLVMAALFDLQPDYWQGFLTYEAGQGNARRGTLFTPIQAAAMPPAPSVTASSRATRVQMDLSDPAAVDQSLLGPVSRSPSKFAPTATGGPNPPLIKGAAQGNRKFFDSPM